MQPKDEMEMEDEMGGLWVDAVTLENSPPKAFSLGGRRTNQEARGSRS